MLDDVVRLGRRLLHLGDPAVFEERDDAGAAGREGSGDLLSIFNCTAKSREVTLPDTCDGRWTLRLTTDAAGYGGQARVAVEIGGEELAMSAAGNVWRAESQSLGDTRDSDAPRRLMSSESASRRTLTMPPWSAALYIRARSH